MKLKMVLLILSWNNKKKGKTSITLRYIRNKKQVDVENSRKVIRKQFECSLYYDVFYVYEYVLCIMVLWMYVCMF